MTAQVYLAGERARCRTCDEPIVCLGFMGWVHCGDEPEGEARHDAAPREFVDEGAEAVVEREALDEQPQPSQFVEQPQPSTPLVELDLRITRRLRGALRRASRQLGGFGAIYNEHAMLGVRELQHELDELAELLKETR